MFRSSVPQNTAMFHEPEPNLLKQTDMFRGSGSVDPQYIVMFGVCGSIDHQYIAMSGSLGSVEPQYLAMFGVSGSMNFNTEPCLVGLVLSCLMDLNLFNLST